MSGGMEAEYTEQRVVERGIRDKREKASDRGWRGQ